MSIFSVWMFRQFFRLFKQCLDRHVYTFCVIFSIWLFTFCRAAFTVCPNICHLDCLSRCPENLSDSLWVNILITHILGFFAPFQKYPFLIFFFFEHVVDEFWKTNSRLVLQETPSPRSLEAFCPLRWNFCPLWRNYRTLWWNHDAISYIMAPFSMDFWNVEVGSL